MNNLSVIILYYNSVVFTKYYNMVEIHSIEQNNYTYSKLSIIYGYPLNYIQNYFKYSYISSKYNKSLWINESV